MSAGFYDVTISVEVTDAERLHRAAAKYADESGAHHWVSSGPEDDLRMLLDRTTEEDSGFRILDSTAWLSASTDEEPAGEPAVEADAPELVTITREVTAEGHVIPAGTVCVVEKRHQDEGSNAGFVDLFDTNTGALFWLPLADVEPATAGEAAAPRQGWFLVIYRPHNTLALDTRYYGPFVTWDTAFDFLCELPALGEHEQPLSGPCMSGVKFVQQLTVPVTG